MPIDPTMSITGAGALGSTEKKANPGVVGKDDFLKLLVAQLKNQDPSNAQDMESMTQQMTQFSMLEQLTNLSAATERNQAVDLLGKKVSYRETGGQIKEGVVEHVDTSGVAPTMTVGGRSGLALADIVSVEA